MPVSSSTEHWIKPDALTINLNHFGDPDYLQVSVLAGAVVMAFKQDVIGYNAAHNYRTWTLEAANTYLETSSAYNVYARLTRSEVNARALVVYDTVLRDIEGREITYAEDGSEILGEANPDYFYMYLGQISASVNSNGESVQREWTIDFRVGNLDTNQYRNEESTGEWSKMFRLNKVTDMIDVLKTFSSAVFQKYFVREKLVTDIKRSIDSDEIVPVSDENLTTSKYVEKKIEGFDGKYLRKDKDDRSKGTIASDKGFEVGNVVNSLITGKGTIIKDNLIQTDRVEIRGSLVAMQLLINEIQGIAGDQVYSDVGNVEEVEDLGYDVYKLKIEKRTEYDFSTFAENDIIKQVVNNMAAGGTDYFMSWSRVLTTNINDNTITVALYQDSEVPGGVNHKPVKGYNVMRSGNSLMPEDGDSNERSNFWTLSSREGRMQFLQNVFKPILEDYNYALTVGKLPDIEAIRNLPVTPNQDVGVVAQTIIAERFYQFDWNGDIKPNKVDRGEWSLLVSQGDSPYRYIQHESLYPDGEHKYVELEQHTVYHYGCKWGCLVDKTTDEPKWNSPSWILLEGDKNYYITFESSNGFQFTASNMSTVITANVSHANRDITGLLMATAGVSVEWLRDTGNVPMDNAWTPTYVGDAKHVISLSRSDMGAGWMSEYRKVKFTCRVHIPYGDNYETIENSISYKL